MVDYVTSYGNIKTTLSGLVVGEDFLLKDDLVRGFFQSKHPVRLGAYEMEKDYKKRAAMDEINLKVIQSYGFIDLFDPDLVAVQRTVDSIINDEDLERVFCDCPRIRVLKKGVIPNFELREGVLFHQHLSKLSKMSIEDVRGLLAAYNFYINETGLTREEFVNYCNLLKRNKKDINPLLEKLSRRLKDVK